MTTRAERRARREREIARWKRRLAQRPASRAPLADAAAQRRAAHPVCGCRRCRLYREYDRQADRDMDHKLDRIVGRDSW